MAEIMLGSITINPIVPVDKLVGSTVTFNVVDSPVLVSNKMTIYKASTQQIIWEDTVFTTNYFHDIPANLQDIVYEGEVIGDKWDYNNKYALTIEATSMGDTYISDKIYFWVYSTPEFYFANITDGQTFQSSNIIADLVYSQAEKESLQSYQFLLYDNYKKLIQSSDVYSSVTTDKIEYHFKYNLSGLENNKVYYIRAKGKTIQGTPLDTGYISFQVQYNVVEGGDYLKLESDDNGTVKGDAHIIIIEPDEGADEYVIENSSVQLLDKTLTYENGYEVKDDYTLSLKMNHTKTRTNNPETIVSMNNGSHTLILTSYVFDDDTMRYHLRVNNGLSDSNYYSDPLNVTDNDTVVVHIRRKNDMFQLKAVKLALT